jgi:hypothetical protein
MNIAEYHVVWAAAATGLVVLLTGLPCALWLAQVILDRRAERDGPVIRNRGKVVK